MMLDIIDTNNETGAVKDCYKGHWMPLLCFGFKFCPVQLSLSCWRHPKNTTDYLLFSFCPSWAVCTMVRISSPEHTQTRLVYMGSNIRLSLFLLQNKVRGSHLKLLSSGSRPVLPCLNCHSLNFIIWVAVSERIKLGCS